MKFAIAIGDKIGDFAYSYLNDCVKDLYKLPYADFLKAEVYQKYDDNDEPMLIPEEHILSLADYLKLTPPTANSFKTKDDEVVNLLFEGSNTQKVDSKITLGSKQGDFNKFKEYADKLGIETVEELQNYLKNKPINQTIEEFLKTEANRHSVETPKMEDVARVIEDSLDRRISRYLSVEVAMTTAGLTKRNYADANASKFYKDLSSISATDWGLRVEITTRYTFDEVRNYIADALDKLVDILRYEEDLFAPFIYVTVKAADRERFIDGGLFSDFVEKDELLDELRDTVDYLSE